MPIAMTCPGCETDVSLPDTLAGKTIRCKKCGETFPVTAKVAAKSKPVVVVDEDDDEDDDDTPKAKPAKRLPAKALARKDEDDEDDDEEDAPKSRKGLLIGGSVLGVLLLVGGGIAGYSLLSGGSSKDATQAAVTPTRPLVPETTTPTPTTKVPETKVDVPATTKAPEPKPEAVATQNPVPAFTDPPSSARPPETSIGLGEKLMAGIMSTLTTDRVTRATVMFKVEAPNGSVATGSGWFGQESNLIFTNSHVLFMKSPGSKEPRKMTVYLNAGTPEQKEIPHAKLKILAVDREIDLALLQVLPDKDYELPTPLKIRPSNDLRPGQNLNTAGFPLGYMATQASGSNKEPEVAVGKSSFVRFVRNNYGQPRRIHVQGGANPGNSGGPILDAEGAVVGVVVEGVGGNIGGGAAMIMGVPTEFCLGLLAGTSARPSTASRTRPTAR